MASITSTTFGENAMTRSLFCLLLTMVLTVTYGCATPPPKSGQGFTLPEGNAETGKTHYVYFQCNACHKIEGVDQLTGSAREPYSVTLGGEVPRIQTYGELVTSIINPSHRLAKGYPVDMVSANGKSKMRNYNDVMTVTELTDLIAFVQSKYKLLAYEATHYEVFMP